MGCACLGKKIKRGLSVGQSVARDGTPQLNNSQHTLDLYVLFSMHFIYSENMHVVFLGGIV